MNRLFVGLAVLGASSMTPLASATQPGWKAVDIAIGRNGTDLPGSVHKYSLPREDLKIVVDGVTIQPALALGSWIAFMPMGSDAMCMGDLVLRDTELSDVMARLIADGIEVTAIHNHLLRTSVPVYYMHIEGRGDPVKLAETVHAALVQSATPLSQGPPAATPTIDLDTSALDKMMGYKGKANGSVYQFSVPREESISEGGIPIPPAMGTAIGINFQSTGAGKTAVSGDFVLLGSEVNPVLRTLRQHGIEVTALHSHMIDESPHLYFMHFWANDDIAKLAQGLKAALELTHVEHAS